MVWINVLPTRPETFVSACQEKGEWATSFSIICWFIWKNMNGFTFSHSSESSSELISSAKAWTKSFVAKEFINQWACKSRRWLLEGNEEVSSGGWLVGLKMTVGLIGILQVEVKAILEGIELAWNSS
ncbi:hypothetical protein GOBAR_DD13703 [Gossypium barbadense]|nr:hypothetical protein GOBAR_DD13703 [Gossypium barbadense]